VSPPPQAATPTISSARFEELAAQAALSLDNLSPDERRAFFKSVKSLELSAQLEKWDPWWTVTAYHSIVTSPTRLLTSADLGLERSCHFGGTEELRCLVLHMTHLPKFWEITSRAPAPQLKYSVFQVVAAYVLTMTLLNGNWWDDRDSAALLLSLCSVLRQDDRFDSLQAAADALLRDARPQFSNAKSMVQGFLAYPIMPILEDARLASCALTDAYLLLESGVRCVAFAKKVAFLASWTVAQPSDALCGVAEDTRLYLGLAAVVPEDPARPNRELAQLQRRG
jgi:hypothetical protein